MGKTTHQYNITQKQQVKWINMLFISMCEWGEHKIKSDPNLTHFDLASIYVKRHFSIGYLHKSEGHTKTAT